MACPICVSPEGAAITAGMRAGAGVLLLAAVLVIAMIARFAFRLWAAENAAAAEQAEQIGSRRA